MDPQARFAAKYLRQHPDATDEKIYEEYLKEHQGKQAMNTRLLGG